MKSGCHARDVQELFRLEKRAGFLRLLVLLFRPSGGMLDVTIGKHPVLDTLIAAGLPRIHFWRD